MKNTKQQRVKDMKDKRKHRRLRISFPLFCYCLASKTSFFSVFEDISIGGMCLVDNRFLSLHEHMEFKIEFSGRIVNCKGKIVWRKYLPDSKEKKAGVEFTYLGFKSRDFIADFISQMKPIRS